jgi:uncharacterized membrane protein (DUF2068 family)
VKEEQAAGPPIEGQRAPRWHPETFWCSLRGHAAPAATVKTISEADALIALHVADDSHMSRCLRCDVWVLTDEANATRESLGELNTISVPQRGKELRDAIILKVIAIDRGIHSFVFALVFLGVLLVELHLGALQNTARHLLDNAQNALNSTGQEASRSYSQRELQRFINLKSGGLTLILLTAAVYSIVEGVEAVGLWMQKRWAEYLTALATAGFLPLEINELAKRVTVVRVGALVINVIVLIYLLWAKRLFGIRGGIKKDKQLIESADQIRLLPGQPAPKVESEPTA